MYCTLNSFLDTVGYQDEPKENKLALGRNKNMLEKELAALRDLGITEGEWAVYAGSALALQGLKSTTDLDVLVTPAELARIKGPRTNDS